MSRHVHTNDIDWKVWMTVRDAAGQLGVDEAVLSGVINQPGGALRGQSLQCANGGHWTSLVRRDDVARLGTVLASGQEAGPA